MLKQVHSSHHKHYGKELERSAGEKLKLLVQPIESKLAAQLSEQHTDWQRYALGTGKKSCLVFLTKLSEMSSIFIVSRHIGIFIFLKTLH